jgi:hypothetical protein
MAQRHMTWLFLLFVAANQAAARSLGPSHVTLNVNGSSGQHVHSKAKASVPKEPVVAKPATAPVVAKAAAPTKAKATVALVSEPKLSPPLHDGSYGQTTGHQSDKKFFGPPFPADYPDDKRPVPDKNIMDKLKGPHQPYPALQSKADYDKDYVKDENSDTGAWKAQFEYDAIRNRMAKENADARKAGEWSDKEGRDVDDAQRRADAAGRDADDARRGVDSAQKEEDDAMKPEDFEGMPPSHEKLEKLKKAVEDAEKNLEKEKAEFAECEKKLKEAEKNLEELKARQVEMEQQLAADTKLWVETKSVRLNLQKSKQEAAHAKRLASDSQLAEAKKAKAETDKVLAAHKAKAEKAQQDLKQQQAELAKAKEELEKATLTLQKLRGYKPASPEPKKSSAPMASFSALVFLALLCQ